VSKVSRPGRGFGQGSSTALEALLRVDGASVAAVERYRKLRELGTDPDAAMCAAGVCSTTKIGPRTLRSYQTRALAGEEPFASHVAALDAAEEGLLETLGRKNLERIAEGWPVEWRKIVFPDQAANAERALRAASFRKALNNHVIPALADAMSARVPTLAPEVLRRLAAGDDPVVVLRTFVHDSLTGALGDD